MEIGKQIKKYRLKMNMSQDDLADKVYVTRQTISNWENNKNYPDIKSLLMLSNLFGVSLDILVKGDLDMMKEQIKEEEIKKFDKMGGIFAVMLIAEMVLPIPLAHFWGLIGLAIWAVLAIASLCYAFRIEKFKKTYDIQTYKEITAFMEGKRLDEMEKYQELGKRPYQHILSAIGAGALTLVIAVIMILVL